MTGFCLGCPIPEILKEIDSGLASFCDRGLFSHEKVRQATTALIRAVADTGGCDEGPSMEPISTNETWLGCRHERQLEFSCIGDALETDNAGVVLDSKIVRREQ